VLTYKVLHGDTPRYLGPFTSTAEFPGRWALHSVGTSRLVVPPVRLPAVSSRVIPVAASQIWNSTGTHRLNSHVAVLQASLEIIFATTILPVAL